MARLMGGNRGSAWEKLRGEGQCRGEVEGHGQGQWWGKVEEHGQRQYKGKAKGHGQGQC